MRIRKIILPVNGTWRGRVIIEEVTADEKERFAAFGPQVLQVGGEFATEGLEFTLPASEVLIPQATQITKTFPTSDDAAEATLWTNTIVTRLSELVDNLFDMGLDGQVNSTVELPLEAP